MPSYLEDAVIEDVSKMKID